MSKRPSGSMFAVLLLLAAAPVLAGNEFVIELPHPPANAPKEAVLFPFDNYSIPLRKGLQMDLITSEHTRAAYNPVLARGKPGAPDSYRIGYYGTVIDIGAGAATGGGRQFHMWYIGDGDRDQVDQEKSTAYLYLLYAVSDDGIHWEKPNL